MDNNHTQYWETVAHDGAKSLQQNLYGPYGTSIYDAQMRRHAEAVIERARKAGTPRAQNARRVAEAVLDHDRARALAVHLN